MNGYTPGTMRRRAFLAVVATSALAAGAAPALGRAPRRRLKTNAFEWTDLADGRVWATGGSTTGGTVMLVASEGQATVVDSKFAGLGPLLRQEAESRAGCAVTTLINTHHHGDHSGGNFAFSGGPSVIAHAAAATRIRESLEGYRRQVQGAADAAGRLGDEVSAVAAREAFAAAAGRTSTDTVDAWTPTRTVNAYPTRHRVGRLDLEVYHFGPGHTDNDLVVHVPDFNVIHCGDLFFNGRHPFFDQNGGVSAAGWARSIRHIIALGDGATKFIAGHGPIGDRAALEKQLAYLERLYEEVGRAGRSGSTRDAVTQMSWPFMDGLDAENLRERAIGAVYDEIFPSPGA